MNIYSIDDMHRGWFIGDFEPSIRKTKDFEVGLLFHEKGEVWPAHYHAEVTEYNVLIRGKMALGDTVIEPRTIFVLNKGEVAQPTFFEDCEILCIKVPSIPDDKVLLGKKNILNSDGND